MNTLAILTAAGSMLILGAAILVTGRERSDADCQGCRRLEQEQTSAHHDVEADRGPRVVADSPSTPAVRVMTSTKRRSLSSGSWALE